MIYLFFTDILSHFVIRSVSVKYGSNRSFSPDLTMCTKTIKPWQPCFCLVHQKIPGRVELFSLVPRNLHTCSSRQSVWKWCSISVIVLVMIMTTGGVEVSFWTSYSLTTLKWYKTKTGSEKTKVFFFKPVLSKKKATTI